MEGIKSGCPNINHLEFVPLCPGDDPEPLEFRHIASLQFLPMQFFDLLVHEHTLTTTDISDLAQSWPKLRYFKIDSCTKMEPLPTLIAFSNHQHIDNLNLHLPLRDLLDDNPKMRGSIGADLAGKGSPTLRRISFHCPFVHPKGTPPESEDDKRTLVKYLLRLFPNLKELQVEGWGISPEAEPEELQDILDEVSKGGVSST